MARPIVGCFALLEGGMDKEESELSIEPELEPTELDGHADGKEPEKEPIMMSMFLQCSAICPHIHDKCQSLFLLTLSFGSNSCLHGD